MSGLVSEWKSCFTAEGSWGSFRFLIALVSWHRYMERALQTPCSVCVTLSILPRWLALHRQDGDTVLGFQVRKQAGVRVPCPVDMVQSAGEDVFVISNGSKQYPLWPLSSIYRIPRGLTSSFLEPFACWSTDCNLKLVGTWLTPVTHRLASE